MEKAEYSAWHTISNITAFMNHYHHCHCHIINNKFLQFSETSDMERERGRGVESVPWVWHLFWGTIFK